MYFVYKAMILSGNHDLKVVSTVVSGAGLLGFFIGFGALLYLTQIFGVLVAFALATPLGFLSFVLLTVFCLSGIWLINKLDNDADEMAKSLGLRQ